MAFARTPPPTPAPTRQSKLADDDYVVGVAMQPSLMLLHSVWL
jgi:hypothetical protein